MLMADAVCRAAFSPPPPSFPFVPKHNALLAIAPHPPTGGAQDYVLDAGIYLDREQLLTGHRATLMLRAALYLSSAGNVRVPVSMVENIELVIKVRGLVFGIVGRSDCRSMPSFVRALSFFFFFFFFFFLKLIPLVSPRLCLSLFSFFKKKSFFFLARRMADG